MSSFGGNVLDFWRRSRGRVDKTKAVVVEGFECFQHLQKSELWEMEAIELGGG
jgi:hypothetical protein